MRFTTMWRSLGGIGVDLAPFLLFRFLLFLLLLQLSLFRFGHNSRCHAGSQL